MKILLKLLIITLIAVLVAIGYTEIGSGHVIIFISKYRVDLSVASMLMVIIILYLFLYLVIRFGLSIFLFPFMINQWHRRKSMRNGYKILNLAMLNYFAGKYNSAFNYALQSSNKGLDTANKFVALLLTFKSATRMFEGHKQDDAVVKLNGYSDKKWQLAKLLTYAEAQYHDHKYGLCLDSLNQALNLDSKNFYARQLKFKVSHSLNDFAQAYEELNWLIKHNGLSKSQAELFKMQLLEGRFAQVMDPNELHEIYYGLDKQYRGNSLIIQNYLVNLIRLNQLQWAVDLLESLDGNEIDSGLDEKILMLVKKVDSQDDAEKLLLIYEKHLEKYKHNISLLLALGILSYTIKSWANAKGYIEASLLLKPTRDGYLYLITIAQVIDDPELLRAASAQLSANIHNLI